MQILRFAQNDMAQSVARSCFEIRPPTDKKRDEPVPMVYIEMRHPRSIAFAGGQVYVSESQGGYPGWPMAVVKTSPMKLPSNPWVEGYVLDYHTVSSTPTGDPYYRFDTKRTELGELLFRLKYRAGGQEVVGDIVDTAAQFVGAWKPPIECVVPAPPSLTRKTQPAVDVARELAARLGLPLFTGAVVKVKATPQMKNIDDWSERQRVLAEALQAGSSDVKGSTILLFDDLIESGSTLRRAAEVLLKDGGGRAIYALVLTRTK